MRPAVEPQDALTVRSPCCFIGYTKAQRFGMSHRIEKKWRNRVKTSIPFGLGGLSSPPAQRPTGESPEPAGWEACSTFSFMERFGDLTIPHGYLELGRAALPRSPDIWAERQLGPTKGRLIHL